MRQIQSWAIENTFQNLCIDYNLWNQKNLKEDLKRINFLFNMR
jgi:hypothetical protein